MPSAKPNTDCPAARLAAVPGAAPVIGAAHPRRPAGASASRGALPRPAAILAATALLLGAAFAAGPASAASIDDPYLGLDSPSVREGDGGATSLTFTARLTDSNGRAKASSKTIVASWEVLSEPGDTATAGKDYTATRGKIVFAPGETTGTIDVSVLGDTEVEGDETLTVKWTEWSDVWLVSYTHTGTIVNDDTTPTVSATLDIANAAAREGSAITFSMRLNNAVPGGFTATPSYTDYSARRGTDYTPNTAAIHFTGAAGETQTFTVATTADAGPEGNEVFTVGLTVSGTRHHVTVTGTAIGIIQSAGAEAFAAAGASSGASVTSVSGQKRPLF